MSVCMHILFLKGDANIDRTCRERELYRVCVKGLGNLCFTTKNVDEFESVKKYQKMMEDQGSHPLSREKERERE